MGQTHHLVQTKLAQNLSCERPRFYNLPHLGKFCPWNSPKSLHIPRKIALNFLTLGSLLFAEPKSRMTGPVGETYESADPRQCTPSLRHQPVSIATANPIDLVLCLCHWPLPLAWWWDLWACSRSHSNILMTASAIVMHEKVTTIELILILKLDTYWAAHSLSLAKLRVANL